ncbi:MAG: PQQ-binding-like beta-propeller repeat protein [Candidatus Bathyarchaeia archaeon]
MNSSPKNQIKKLTITTFLILIILTLHISILTQQAKAYILDINITTNKPTYNAGETVIITGNVTLDGALKTDTIAAIQVDFPNGNPFVLRTVETGDVSGRYWRVQILDMYTCDSQGTPKNLFSRGTTAYLNITIKNFDVVNRYVLIAVYVQCSDNTPLTAFFTSGFTIEGGQTVKLLSSMPIPSHAPTGEAQVSVSLFKDYPKNLGAPYCPEKKAKFYISTTTPSMPPQPQYFNVTFKLPATDIPADKYVIYATTEYQISTAIDIKSFLVLGPVPQFTYSPSNPMVCQTVTFDGSASYDPTGTIIDYTWQFGDGTTAKGQIVTHIYDMGGYYTVKLTVTNNKGIYNSTERLVIVTEAWPMFRHDPKHKGSSSSLASTANSTKWQKTIGSTSTEQWMQSSPAIVGNKVFIGSINGTLYAFNATNGALIWKTTPAPGYKIYSSPAYTDNLLFIGSENGLVYAVNATNGSVKYSITTGGPVYSSPVIYGNKVFIGSTDGKVYAFYINGTTIWTSTLDGAVYTSPAAASGKVFVATQNGSIYALNEITGGILWRKNLAPGVGIYSSPSFANDRVFTGSRDKKIYALDAQTGTILWNLTTNSEIYSSPAIADNTVFVGSTDGKLYALNALTGNLLWSKEIGPIKWSSPLVAERKVIVGTTTGRLYAIEEESGEIWWSYQTGGIIDSSPAVLNDIIYVTSKDGKLYAIQGSNHDVAVLKVIPLKTPVKKGETATINATIWNKGSFTETISVTASYNTTNFYTTSINLGRGKQQTLTIYLDTTSLSAGNYIISVSATLQPPIVDENPSDNSKSCQIRVEYADISIENVTASTPNVNLSKPIPMKKYIGRDYGTLIYVTTKNNGNFTESNVQIIVYWSNNTYANQTIGTKFIQTILPGQSIITSLSWDTTNLAYGNYTVSAYAVPVLGEGNISNNLYIKCSVLIVISGDVTSIAQGVPEGKVDMRDVGAICNKFGTNPSKPNWDPNKDVNNDGKVDMRDIGIACGNYGKTAKYY